RRVAVVAVAAAVVAVGTLALVYGPRSSSPGHGEPPPGAAVARLVPTDTTTSAADLAADARRLTVRLSSLGDTGARAVVRQRSVVVVGGGRLPVTTADLAAVGQLEIRPVLCLSAPYTAAQSAPSGTAVPAGCPAPYSLKSALLVNTSTGTANLQSIPLDPTLAAIATSTPAYDQSHPASPVLLALTGAGGERNLLGPSAMDGSSVASASAVFESPQWVVDVTLTPAGAVRWDAVAQRNFHRVVAFDVDGQILSAPIVQPAQTAFASFDGKVQISGSFSASAAETLAAELSSGPLAAPLSSTAAAPA
ncbi:MAG: SecDF P1 head subdomain-containing protein, partial [Acidimicrobiales bacterium]